SWLLANGTTAGPVLAKTPPPAETQVRQCWPHCSAGSSLRHSKRICAGLVSAMERSLANAIRQANASVEATARYRFTPTPFVPPVSSWCAWHWRHCVSLFSEQETGHGLSYRY